MLKKLYKYEFYSLFRSLVPIYAAILGFAALSRLTMLVEIENSIFNIIKGFMTAFYVFAVLAVFIVGLVVVVMRFYKNLLSHEGYLTFTLPFTPTQHIVCKLLCGVVVMIVSFVMVIASLMILAAGTGIITQIFEFIEKAFASAALYYSKAQLAGTAALFVLLMLVSLFQSLLMFYASIAIGQQFKSKAGGAVVAYICLYAASQVVSTVLIAVAALVLASAGSDFQFSTIGAFQAYIGFLTVFCAAFAAAYFFIARYFLTKKLNLE